MALLICHHGTEQTAHNLEWTTCTLSIDIYTGPLKDYFSLVKWFDISMRPNCNVPANHKCTPPPPYEYESIIQEMWGMEGFWPMLPARAWLLAAPMRTPPARTQSHHPRWSSSGSPATSCPSSPQRVAPCLGPVVSGAPPFRCAPGSLHTSSADSREEERILESYWQNLNLVSLFSYSILAVCMRFFF